MKKIITILLTSLILVTSCGERKTEPKVTTELKFTVTYTNGDVDTLTTKWTTDKEDSVYSYLQTGDMQACLCVSSHRELGRNVLACGVRKYNELERKRY